MPTLLLLVLVAAAPSSEIRFPFGMTPTTAMSDLPTRANCEAKADKESAPQYDACMSAAQAKAGECDEIRRVAREPCVGKPSVSCKEGPGGTQLCFAMREPSFQIDVLSFKTEGAGFTFVEKDGVHALSRVTLCGIDFRDCNDMIRPYASAVALVDRRYQNANTKVDKGPNFASKACKHYMQRGQVYYRVSNDSWSVQVDSYYSKGSYRVILEYTNLDNDRTQRMRDFEERAKTTAESLDKL